MKITAINAMAHRPGMYRISVDNKPLGYLNADDVLSFSLARGSDISQETYLRLITRIKYAAQYSSALGYASCRLRSKAEVERYLKGRACDIKTSASIIKELESLGIIDESKLAAAYVHDAELLKPLSRNMLALKLKQKRIDQELIDSSIEASGYDDKLALDKLVSQKSERYKGNQPRFFRYLLRQGFSYSEIEKRIGRPERSSSFKRSPRAR
ncbi:MAG: regulatory protein RecX [Candidatus Saccharimonadales bacterium]